MFCYGAVFAVRGAEAGWGAASTFGADLFVSNGASAVIGEFLAVGAFGAEAVDLPRFTEFAAATPVAGAVAVAFVVGHAIGLLAHLTVAVPPSTLLTYFSTASTLFKAARFSFSASSSKSCKVAGSHRSGASV